MALPWQILSDILPHSTHQTLFSLPKTLILPHQNTFHLTLISSVVVKQSKMIITTDGENSSRYTYMGSIKQTIKQKRFITDIYTLYIKNVAKF